MVCCRHCWFSSVAYEPTKGAVVLHCVPSCKTRINRQECRGTLLPCGPVHFHPHTASLQCTACSQEPGKQSKLVSILKDHSLNRVRCHNPHCTNATHCKKQLSVLASVVTYFCVVQYEWSSPLLILLKQDGRIHKKTHKRPQTP